MPRDRCPPRLHHQPGPRSRSAARGLRHLPDRRGRRGGGGGRTARRPGRELVHLGEPRPALWSRSTSPRRPRPGPTCAGRATSVSPCSPTTTPWCAASWPVRSSGASTAIAHRVSDDGAVTLDEGLAQFDCTIYREVDAGDHILVLLELHAVAARRPRPWRVPRSSSTAADSGSSRRWAEPCPTSLMSGAGRAWPRASRPTTHRSAGRDRAAPHSAAGRHHLLACQLPVAAPGELAAPAWPQRPAVAAVIIHNKDDGYTPQWGSGETVVAVRFFEGGSHSPIPRDEG